KPGLQEYRFFSANHAPRLVRTSTTRASARGQDRHGPPLLQGPAVAAGLPLVRRPAGRAAAAPRRGPLCPPLRQSRSVRARVRVLRPACAARRRATRMPGGRLLLIRYSVPSAALNVALGRIARAIASGSGR